jgi:NAD(P)-dependent dehydrogenase (short-subunit alcohol dehydrogenase family)
MNRCRRSRPGRAGGRTGRQAGILPALPPCRDQAWRAGDSAQRAVRRSCLLAARIPAGRIGTEDDMAGAAVYLASRAGDYVVGSTLVVDGGATHAR